MSAWKNLERQTAKALGGKRNGRGKDFSQRMPDVSHALFSVECKHRKLLPRLLRLGLEQAKRYDPSKPGLLVIKEKGRHGALVVLTLADFTDLLGPLQEHEQPEEEATAAVEPIQCSAEEEKQ